MVKIENLGEIKKGIESLQIGSYILLSYSNESTLVLSKIGQGMTLTSCPPALLPPASCPSCPPVLNPSSSSFLFSCRWCGGCEE